MNTNGSEIGVRIHDDGEPIPEETAKALFDLGFQREGSRMASTTWGLYSAREMVRRHGGDIRVESEADSGTTVLVTLRIRTVIDAIQ
jgi:signal transduction histidine kinase